MWLGPSSMRSDLGICVPGREQGGQRVMILALLSHREAFHTARAILKAAGGHPSLRVFTPGFPWG